MHKAERLMGAIGVIANTNVLYISGIPEDKLLCFMTNFTRTVVCHIPSTIYYAIANRYPIVKVQENKINGKNYPLPIGTLSNAHIPEKIFTYPTDVGNTHTHKNHPV